MPFFSVIIPTYNHAKFISMAIDSVIQQSFDDFELIIVDNASTDNTEEIIKQYQEQYKEYNINYIKHEKNLERSASRNTGIENSKGEYICFLDSDDYYLKDHLRSLHEFIKNKNFPVAFFYTDIIQDEEGTLTKVVQPPLQSANNPTFFLEVDEHIIPPRVCIHTEILKKHRFDREVVMVEDTDLWIRIVSEYPMFHVEEYTVVYRLHEENSTNLGMYNACQARLKGLKILFKKPQAQSLSKKVRKRAISRCYFGIAKYHRLNNRKMKMIFSLFRSIIIFPSDSLTKHKIFLIFTHLPGISFFIKLNKNFIKH